MAVISSEMYEALVLADVPEDKARAAAAEVARAQDLVSKTDLFEFGVQLRADMEKRFADVDKRFADMEKRFADMDKRFADMEKRFAEGEVRSEVRDRRLDKMERHAAEADMRLARIEASLAVLKFAVFSGGAVVLALLIKLTFFP